MRTWIVTGISGSGRIELLKEISEDANSKGFPLVVHDVGELIGKEASRLRINVTDELFLDMDQSQLHLLRSNALKRVQILISKSDPEAIHLVGVHATFKWKGRLIPGISYQDVIDLEPDAFVNVNWNVKDIYETNSKNEKWSSIGAPELDETQEWMMIEEFVTEVLADVVHKPMYIVAREHNLPNLTDLFISSKKKVYLSYPITAVQKDNPELIDQIHNDFLPRLEEMFVVFNPMSIEDMPLTYNGAGDDMPELVGQLTSKAKETIKSRTIERDFQLIDQSDAVVVLYLTEKVSPGVLAEVYYAHRNMTRVFMAFPYRRSPFIEDAVTHIENDLGGLLGTLEEFSKT